MKVRLVLAFLVVAGLASGQAILQYGSAAAGGSVAGAASKPVSDSVTAIMKKLDDTMKSTEPSPPPKKKAQEAQKYGEPISDAGLAATWVSPAGPARSSKAAGPAEAPVAPVVLRREPPLPLVTTADLSAVSVGMRLEEFSPVLKRTSARIMIPDDGKLTEVWTYTSGGRYLGTVRISDGAVIAVRLAEP